MTWYAHQIFARPEPTLRAELLETFPNSVYALPDLIGGVPPAGLLVVRELCTPESSPANWFRQDAHSWLLPEASGDEPVLAPGDVWRGDDEWMLYSGNSPPTSFLAFLHRLSRATGELVSFYGASTWGGDWEYAYAWVFDGTGDADKVYTRSTRDVPGIQVWDPRLPDRPRETIVDGDVLTLTLDHYGGYPDGGYFLPHTRGFDWERWREGASRRRGLLSRRSGRRR